MSIVDVVLEKVKGTRWYNMVIVFLLASAFFTFTGPSVQWVVNSYAAEKLDAMLIDRGITKDGFKKVQDKLFEVDGQTDGLKKDLNDLKTAVQGLVLEQSQIKETLKQSDAHSKQQRAELKASLDALTSFLLNHPRSP